jgi:uncharacterized protein (DUF1330 family)
MPAYMIALNRSVHDRQKLEAYWRAAGPTFEGRGAKPLLFIHGSRDWS